MADRKRILIAEDNAATRLGWCELIVGWGYDVESAADGERAAEMAEYHKPDILLLDLKLPRKDGLTVLREMRAGGLCIPTIVISGEGEIPDAVQSIKLGAHDYLRKPVDPTHLKRLLINLCTQMDLSEENRRLKHRLLRAGEVGRMVGRSRSMRRIVAMLEQVAAASAASTIIQGESGTGKELAARTIHDLSPRRNGPYIAINCAALPETLMESELFGHERGAFTGADRQRQGCFELADGGTLLLDEITEMKFDLQAKLLRVIEERKLRRLAGASEIPFDVRVLASTNRNPEDAIRDGRLREDLYYRLNVFKVELPPLRQRVEDIPALVGDFLEQFAPVSGKLITGVDNACLEAFKTYHWPGNVRQLRNAIERAVVVSSGPTIGLADLPPEVTRRNPIVSDSGSSTSSNFEPRLGWSLNELERAFILKTLEHVGGHKQRAAEILGISLKTLYNRLERYQTSSFLVERAG